MDQQQLLMIVLALIIVAIAISLFRSNAIEGKRDILIEETSSIGVLALQYFKKPSELNGGGTSFVNFTMPNQMVTTCNGTFKAGTATDDQITIIGTGNEVVTGNGSIRVQTFVNANEIYMV
jgi:hypothetical protein